MTSLLYFGLLTPWKILEIGLLLQKIWMLFHGCMRDAFTVFLFEKIVTSLSSQNCHFSSITLLLKTIVLFMYDDAMPQMFCLRWQYQYISEFRHIGMIISLLFVCQLGNGSKDGLFSVLLRDYNAYAAASCMGRLAKLRFSSQGLDMFLMYNYLHKQCSIVSDSRKMPF